MSVIGVLTAGGDCPGLNAVIRGVVARTLKIGPNEVVGIMNGWEGLMDDETRPLDRDAVRGILATGGTILGTSRRDPYVHGDGSETVRKTLDKNGIDTLVVIGGDGTLQTALKLADDGVRVIGVPKTIDNDIAATDVTFGFDTAVQIASEAIDRLTTTAEAHNRVILCEVMGRTKGWSALYAGLASGADAILIPEVPVDLEEVAKIIKRRHRQGRKYSIVVVAEGVDPPEKTDLPRTIPANIASKQRRAATVRKTWSHWSDRCATNATSSIQGKRLPLSFQCTQICHLRPLEKSASWHGESAARRRAEASTSCQ